MKFKKRIWLRFYSVSYKRELSVWFCFLHFTFNQRVRHNQVDSIIKEKIGVMQSFQVAINVFQGPTKTLVKSSTVHWYNCRRHQNATGDFWYLQGCAIKIYNSHYHLICCHFLKKEDNHIFISYFHHHNSELLNEVSNLFLA